jgi:hypothetical protein
VEAPLAVLPESFERRSKAIAEALFAGESGPADPARIDWVVRDFADFLARVQPRSRFIFLLCTWVLTWIAPLFVWKFGPLETLDLELRVRALERIEDSIFGPSALGPKIMLCTIWFEHPEIREATCLK